MWKTCGNMWKTQGLEKLFTLNVENFFESQNIDVFLTLFGPVVKELTILTGQFFLDTIGRGKLRVNCGKLL